MKNKSSTQQSSKQSKLTLSCCKNKAISLGKMFLASERAFVLFHFAGDQEAATGSAL